VGANELPVSAVVEVPLHAVQRAIIVKMSAWNTLRLVKDFFMRGYLSIEARRIDMYFILLAVYTIRELVRACFVDNIRIDSPILISFVSIT